MGCPGLQLDRGSVPSPRAVPAFAMVKSLIGIAAVRAVCMQCKKLPSSGKMERLVYVLVIIGTDQWPFHCAGSEDGVSTYTTPPASLRKWSRYQGPQTLSGCCLTMSQPRPNKRLLAYNKCTYCRQDKKKVQLPLMRALFCLRTLTCSVRAAHSTMAEPKVQPMP
jgi:hypothetical protein